MKTIDYTLINAAYADSVNVELQKLLADIQILYSNVRGFHWNIKGKNFYELHSKFEKVYTDLSEKADEIAERILMLGGTPISKYSEYQKVSNIKEAEFTTDGPQMIKHLLESIKSLIASERKILAMSSSQNDEVTTAILTDYLKEQEKEIWMLSAYTL